MGIKGLKCARRQTYVPTDGQTKQGVDRLMGMQVARVKNTFPRNIHKTAADETGGRKTLDPDKWREDGMRFLGDNMFSCGETTIENKSPLAVSRKSTLTVIDEYRLYNFILSCRKQGDLIELYAFTHGNKQYLSKFVTQVYLKHTSTVKQDT